MKRLVALLVVATLAIVLASCDTQPYTPPVDTGVKETVCIAVDDIDFYASTVQSTLGSKDVIMLETAYGDVEVDQETYDYTELDVYSQLCIETVDGVADEFVSARLLNLDVPTPPIEYVEVEVEVEKIVEVEVVVVEEVEVEVPVEVFVQTHDVIDPATWVALDHPVHYYFIQENVVQLVYITDDFDIPLSEMFVITIIFDPNTVFSDQVMMPSIVYYLQGLYQGIALLDSDLVDTEFGSIEEYVEDFILNNTQATVRAMYEEATTSE